MYNISNFIKNKNTLKYFLIFCVFLFYFIVALQGLTHSSIWYDEGIEYFFSKYFFTSIPLNMQSFSPYERFMYVLQPPLYNFVMHFWLMISDSEYWFRLFGVIMGAVTLLGIYKAITQLANYKIALLFCAFTACLFNYIFYCQECAEYNLMLAFVSWGLYFFVRLLKNITVKDIVLFTLFCCLAVWTQYGSAFFVAGLAIVLFLKTLCEKDYKSLKLLGTAYSVALTTAALTLYLFFIQFQIGREDIVSNIFNVPFAHNNFIYDIVISFLQTIYYLLSCSNSHVVFRVTQELLFSQLFLVILFILSLLYSLFQKNNKYNKFLSIGFLFVWIIYYFAVKSGVYAYGNFENRYELFLYPIFIVVFGISLYDFIGGILKFKLNKPLKYIFLFAIVVSALNFCFINLQYIKTNWMKEDFRGLVNYWYENKCYEKPSIIYYAAKPGFGFYFLHDSRYKKEYENSIIMQPWQRYAPQSDFINFFNDAFKSDYPDSFYFCMGHNFNRQAVPVIEAFISLGYDTKEVFSSKDAQIVLFIRDKNIFE